MKTGIRVVCFIILLLIFAIQPVCAQESQKNVEKKDSVKIKKWRFPILPAISFDSDLGFQYGALMNIYYYGDGSTYPEYLHSLYIEWSQTTKGSGISRLYYDSEYLLPNKRITADISYLTEKAMQFYGFNGYDAVYNPNWEDDTHPDYRSRLYYRHDRRIFRAMASIQGNISKSTNKYKWIAGFAYYNVKVGPLDLDRLNKGKEEGDKLPDIPGLYDNYVSWGVIRPEEQDGNKVTYLKGGIIYDTRDFDFNPFKGIWSEAVLSYAPDFLGNWNSDYWKLTLIHRQYFTIVPKKLAFAYRVGYQGTIAGEVPFHMQPHIVPTFLTGASSQGLGGSRTLRGVLRNRVVGDGIALGNLEMRWKFLETVILNSKIFLGTNVFFDIGGVVDKIEINTSEVPVDEFNDFFDIGADGVHMSTGIGLKAGLNDNFIVSFDFGKALDSRDGNTGFYISLNYLF